MRPFCFFLFLFYFFGLTSTSANAADDCDVYAKAQAEEYLDRINEIMFEFNQSVAEFESQYYANPYPNQPSYEDVLAHLLNRFKFHTLKERYDTAIYQMVANIANDEQNVKLCDSRDALEDALDNRVGEFDDIAKGTLQELAERVALEDIDEGEGLAVISAFSYGYAEKVILKSNNADMVNIFQTPQLSNFF